MTDFTAIKQKMYNVVSALYEVHNVLGPGLNEHVYQEGLQEELELRGVPYQREVLVRPEYKGKLLKADFRLDFLVDGIIVEMKSVPNFTDVHRAQLYNYIRLYKAEAGILVNFSLSRCNIERYLYDKGRNEILTASGIPLNSCR